MAAGEFLCVICRTWILIFNTIKFSYLAKLKVKNTIGRYLALNGLVFELSAILLSIDWRFLCFHALKVLKSTFPRRNYSARFVLKSKLNPRPQIFTSNETNERTKALGTGEATREPNKRNLSSAEGRRRWLDCRHFHFLVIVERTTRLLAWEWRGCDFEEERRKMEPPFGNRAGRGHSG